MSGNHGVIAAAKHGLCHWRRGHLQRGGHWPHRNVASTGPLVDQWRRFPVIVLVVKRRLVVTYAGAVWRRIVVLVVVVDIDGEIFGRARIAIRRHVIRR